VLKKKLSLVFLGFLIVLLVLSLFEFVPSVKAQESSAKVFFDKPIDWQALWILFNSHAMWDLEWYNSTSSVWVSLKSDLTIVRNYPKEDTCKITLIFNASQTGNYRFTFAIDVRVKGYVTKLDKYQYILGYDDYSIVFDWSDVMAIGGLQITHGMKEVDGQKYFWFRMRRDDVPKGAHIEIDPSVQFTSSEIETFYPTSYNLISGTQYVSGSLTDLQSNNEAYMQFRSYASASDYVQVTFVAAGAGAATATTPTTANILVPYPTGLQANDLLLLQTTVRDLVSSPTTPSGWTLLYGPDAGSTLVRQWIFYKFATGSETGTQAVSCAVAVCRMGRMYAFRNVATSSFTEGGGFGQGTVATISAQSVTTTGVKRLDVSFVFVSDDNAVGSFTGETGGDWTETMAEFTTTSGADGCIQLQSATMASAGTISGGTYAMAAADQWGVRAFALIPTSVPSGYTCEFEFTGTSNTGDWTELFWLVESSFTATDVTVTYQLYDYFSGQYPASGDGYMTSTIGATDVSIDQTISINPTYFRDGSGNWKIKVKGVKSGYEQFDLKVDFIDPTVTWATVSVTSVHTCPLDTHTFVIAYHDETNDDFSFQIYDSNGTQVLAETDVDTTSGGSRDYTSVGVSAFSSTTFVIGWADYGSAPNQGKFAVYNKAGTLLSGPTTVDADIGYTSSYSVQVSCFNSTYFVIGWYDCTDQDATFAVYTSSSTLTAGPTDVDTAVASNSFSVSVSTFNSTTFVIGWFDGTDLDATFAIYNSAGTLLAGPIDADTDVSYCMSVSVSTFNSTYFVIGWYDRTDQDATFAVYNSAGTLKTGPIDADTTAGSNIGGSVQVSALNSTYFIISWYDYVDFDLSYATYKSIGTLIASNDIESWPTADNVPFKYQSPCSHESATNIGIYNGNWIIAYANTTAQAIWRAYKPDGTEWDGTIPSGGQEYSRTASQSITLSLVASKLFEITRPVTQAIGIALAGTRQFDITRMASQGISFNLATSRIADFIRVATQTVTTSFQTSRLGEWFRSVSQSITASLTANRLIDITRLASQNIGLSITTSRLAEFIRSASQTFNIALATSRIGEFFRSVSQTITATLNVAKLSEFVRTASQTIGLTLQGIGEKISLYFRDAVLTITTSFQTSRLAEWFKGVSQSITFVFSTQRLAEFTRVATQSIGLSFQAIAETIASYFRNVALTITTTLNANRLIEVTKQASQTLNFIFNGERLIDISRFVTQTITFALQGLGSIVTDFERFATLSLTFTHGVMGIFDFPVDLALVLAAFAIVMAIVGIGLAATKKD
jgi:hypothetical protein